MLFEYQVRDQRGKLRRGTWDAAHKAAVVEGLLQQEYYIIYLREVVVQDNKSIDINKLVRVSNFDLMVMTRQLATMLSAGLPILRALRILQLQTPNGRLKAVLVKITGDVEAGLSLGEALAQYPQIFSPIYVNMVKAGEMGGLLEEVLNRLYVHLEKEQELISSLKSASLYPVITTIIALGVLFLTVTLVMPRFADVFQSSGVVLPWFTQMLLGAGRNLPRGLPVLIIIIAASTYLVKRGRGTRGGRSFFDNLLLHMPVLGRTINQIVAARFTNTLGTLIKTGIPLLKALEAAGESCGNAVVEKAAIQAGRSIKEGYSLTAPLQKSGIFEPMVTDMIAVGEETGTLDDMLMQISRYYDGQLQQALNALTTLIEPLLIIIVAILVGSIVIAMLLPLLDMVNLVGF